MTNLIAKDLKDLRDCLKYLRPTISDYKWAHIIFQLSFVSYTNLPWLSIHHSIPLSIKKSLPSKYTTLFMVMKHMTVMWGVRAWRTHTLTHIHTLTMTLIHLYINTHTLTHTHIHSHIHTYIYKYTYIHIHTYIHIYTYTRIHTYTHLHTYTYIHKIHNKTSLTSTHLNMIPHIYTKYTFIAPHIYSKNTLTNMNYTLMHRHIYGAWRLTLQTNFKKVLSLWTVLIKRSKAWEHRANSLIALTHLSL